MKESEIHMLLIDGILAKIPQNKVASMEKQCEAFFNQFEEDECKTKR